jgi:hypothetical protein
MLLAAQRTKQLEPEIIWAPIPGSSQELALDTRCNITLYEGARGPGKTITQLMRFRRRVGLGYGAFWRGVIFDREFDNLSGLVTESKKWFPKFGDGCEFKESAQAYKWVWPTGEELLFRHVKKPADYDGFHGHEYPFIGWNELTKYPAPDLFNKFMSVNRSTFMPERDTPKRKPKNKALEARQNAQGVYEVTYDTPDGKPLPEIPLEVFATTNPNGPGHNWVRMRFIDGIPRGTVKRTLVEVFNPRTQENEIITRTQIAIFGSYRENIYLPPEYIAELESIEDENLKAAWLYGSWDIVTGGALDDVWKSKVHVLPRFVIPKGWSIDRAFDWGSSKPFSVGWFAESNGEEAQIIFNQQLFTFCPPAGTIVQFYEWYGHKGALGTNTGLKMSAGDIAKGIKLIEDNMIAAGWISERPSAGPADNSISETREADVDTIEKKMADNGIVWARSDKSPGSRIIGLQLIRDRLSAATKKQGEPALYFMVNCAASIALTPRLPRDEKKIDDVDTDAEDHAYDMLRYRVLKGADRSPKRMKILMPQ